MNQNTSSQDLAVSCFRCGRTLTNPISVALGIGPICRSRRGTGGGGYGGGPGYPHKDTAMEVPPGFGHTKGLCKCTITSIPPDLLGVTYAKECSRYCCDHCPSHGDAYCPAELLRVQGRLRPYATTDCRYCLGYWVENVDDEERLWAVFYDTDDSVIMPNMLWKARPLPALAMVPSARLFTSLGNPNSLLEAQIMTIQQTPLET